MESMPNKSILILRESNKPILFRSKKYGTVKLHSFIRFGDFRFFLSLRKNNKIDSREFTVRVLNHFIMQSPTVNLTAWEDKSLVLLARKWTFNAIKGSTKAGIKNFDEFRDEVSKYIDETNDSIKDNIRGISEIAANQSRIIAESLAPLTNQLVKSISSQMSDVFSGTINALNTAMLYQSSLIPKLPDFKIIFDTVQETVRETNEITTLLEKSGFEHAASILEDRISRELLKVRPDKQQAVITKRLMNITTKYEFANEIERLFNEPRLRGRWTAMKQALLAHQAHHYFVSIPVFLAQAEGIFTELLVTRNLAYKEKNRIFALKNGSPKKNTKNKAIGLNTLNEKVTHAKGHFDDELIIKVTVDALVGRFISKRNDILHGRINNYGNAKISTQTLLLVFTLAGMLERDLKG